MQSDNDFSSSLADRDSGQPEDQQDTTMQWLLDQDYADPMEKLFVVSEAEHSESGLTEYETEIANRPMFGGKATADDLSSMFTEEIVMTAPGQGAGIYSTSDSAAAAAPVAEPEPTAGTMAIDHSRNNALDSVVVGSGVAEGFDILGLVEEDDMGERFLVLQKERAALKAEPIPEPVVRNEPLVNVNSEATTIGADPAGSSLLCNPETELKNSAKAVDTSEEFESLEILGSDDTLGFLSSADSLEILGSADSTESFGSADALEFLGSDDSLESFGSAESPESSGSDDDLEFLGSDDSLESFGSAESPEFSGSDDSLETFGSTDALEFLGSDDSLESFGSAESPESSGSADALAFLGSDDSLESFGSAESPESSESADALEFLGSDDSLESFGSAESSEFSGSDDSLETFGSADALEFLGSDDSLESFGSAESPESSESAEALEFLGSDNSLESFGSAESSESSESSGSADALESLGSDDSLETFGSVESSESSGSADALEFLGSDDSLESFGSAESPESSGSDDALEFLGSDDSLESFGSAESPESSGSADALEFLGSDDSLETFGSVESPESSGSDDALEFLGSDDSLETFGSVESSEFSGSDDALEFLGSDDSLETFGSDESHSELTTIEAEPAASGWLCNTQTELGSSVEAIDTAEELESLETLSSADSLESFGSDDFLVSSGSDDSLENLGSAEPLESLGSDDSLESFGSDDSLESFGSDDSLESFGSADTLESFGSADTLESFGSADTLESFGSDDSLEPFGSDDSLESFGSDASPEILGSADSAESFDSDDCLESFGSHDSLEPFDVLDSTESSADDADADADATDLLSAGDTQIVQSEHTLSADEIIEQQDSSSTGGFDVFDYVAANEPPLDDEDFDQYLLRGGQLNKRDTSVDGLTVDRTEGIASVDPQVEVEIDYHEDFIQSDGFNGGTVTAITAVIADLMDEVSAAVEHRLHELSLETGSVQVEVMLATDAESSTQCRAENYLPILEVARETPAVLKRLGQAEIDAIYLRLSSNRDASNWNALFVEGFKAPGDHDEMPGEILDQQLEDSLGKISDGEELESDQLLADFGVDETPAKVELPDSAVFDEDLFNTDISDEFEHELSGGQLKLGEMSLASADDISVDMVFDDDIFSSDLSEEMASSSEKDDFAVDLTPGNTEIEEALAAPGGDLSSDSVFDEDIFSVDISDEFEASHETSASDSSTENPELHLGMAEAATPSAIFDEDIFSTDLEDEFSTEHSNTGVDLEGLIKGLADVEADIDEICGAALDEFSDNENADIESAAPEAALLEESPEPEPVAAAEETDFSWCVPADIKFSFTNKAASEVFADFLDAFIEEGASELEKLEDAIGEWEKNISSETAFAPIPRGLHTLKGIAKSVGLQRYGTLIHNFETLLDSLERPAVGQDHAYFRIVNAWLDATVKGFQHIETDRSDIASELPSHSKAPVVDMTEAGNTKDNTGLAGSDPQAKGADAAPQFRQTVLEENKKEKQLADEGAKVLAAQQTIRMSPDALDRMLGLTNEAQQLGVRSSQSTVRSKRAAAELLARLSSVRAHVSKIADRALLSVSAKGNQANSALDALEMDQYSELQEAANILREGVEDLDDLIHVSSRQITVAEALLKQQASVISSLGSSIQAARVVPVSRLMPGLRRIVRNVSADLGKAVSFRIINEVGALDRDNHARCQIILEHMIRNALDHGIEMPGIRVAAGKDATGSITIDASKQGADYIVTLSDDGKGIDPEFMRDMAYEKGLDIDVDMLSDEEAIRLIFHKGFSTANALSEISGRGVGMDIVLSELQQIGGDIEIESKVGVGTSFRVRIPSNVTVNGALLVAAAEVSYAIPLDGLIAVEHVPVSTFYDAIERGTRLSLFGMECDPAYLATICDGSSLPERSAWNATVPVIIAGSERRYMAIAIDDVKQALELVIRSLGSQFSMIPGLAGGATTADGQSVVALDLNALVASATSEESSPVSLRKEREERMLVLVVDDSRTQRMVATSQFDTLGVETVTAENGLVAIDLLNTTHRLPDVVLLDIEMPVKDGIQTLREIRKSERYRDLPVIMVTSRTGAKHRALAEEAGCNGYMGKPFNFPKLVEQIADLTDHKFQLS